MTANIGEIWMVDFGAPRPGEPAFIRPALLLAPSDPDDWASNTFVMIPFTTTDRNYVAAIEVRPSERNGLTATSYAQVDMLRTLPELAGVRYVGEIDPEDWAMIRFVTAQYMGYVLT